MTNKGVETRKEIRLAKKGNIHDLQLYRAKRFYKHNTKSIPFRAIVTIEQNMRKLVQREMYLTEKIKSQASDDQILQKQLSKQTRNIGSMSGNGGSCGIHSLKDLSQEASIYGVHIKGGTYIAVSSRTCLERGLLWTRL
jgi:hypothetical protein